MYRNVRLVTGHSDDPETVTIEYKSGTRREIDEVEWWEVFPRDEDAALEKIDDRVDEIRSIIDQVNPHHKQQSEDPQADG